jgi:hypothetical protein
LSAWARGASLTIFLKLGHSMLFNERDVRQNGIIGKMKKLSFVGAKVFANC